jgi:hypothetical protein
MTTPLKQALIEAAWLLQAFVAALEALRVVAFFERWHNAYIFVYVLFFLSIPQFPSPTMHSI